MDINFYKSAHGGKIMGVTCASPEEFQSYSAPLTEVPEGSHLVTRVRTTKQGRREILVGSAPVGEKLALDGEDAGPLPAPKTAAALVIPESVRMIGDADLETMAVRNGVTVTDAWRKRSKNLRQADVAKAMADRKAGKQTAVA